MQSVTPQNRHVTSVTDASLRVHWEQKKPLLLGYSGGPDSKALLYALLECGVIPHIAHVDHGWREESQKEAKAIEEEAKNLGCPFISTRLNPKDKTEDEARNARYTFFASIAPEYEALLLAHHADDLAETVLKRVLEGAHLPHLGGMEPISRRYGIAIWRPFLTLKKKEILEFLNERSLYPFFDSTNSDPSYLRSRMRERIFPFLNEEFGKQIQDNLTLLSKRSFELKAYLDEQIEKIPMQKGPWGILADLNGSKTIEQRHFLQKMAGVALSREVMETLLKWVRSQEKSKILRVKTKNFWWIKAGSGSFLNIQKIQIQSIENNSKTIYPIFAMRTIPGLMLY